MLTGTVTRRNFLVGAARRRCHQEMPGSTVDQPLGQRGRGLEQPRDIALWIATFPFTTADEQLDIYPWDDFWIVGYAPHRRVVCD